jgi:translation initiation factor IF-3
METAAAIQMARQQEVDLVEVAGKATPPVCKIIDFKKFKYLEQKKESESKKKSRRLDIKEIRFTPFISKNDLDYRIRRAEEFLKEGHKVRITVKFVGRQITHKQYGYDLLKTVNGSLSTISTVEIEPKFIGKFLSMILAPIGHKKKQNEKKED